MANTQVSNFNYLLIFLLWFQYLRYIIPHALEFRKMYNHVCIYIYIYIFWHDGIKIVLILDSSLEHNAHVCRKTNLLLMILKFVTSDDVNKFLKQIKLLITPHTCTSHSKLPSNLSTMQDGWLAGWPERQQHDPAWPEDVPRQRPPQDDLPGLQPNTGTLNWPATKLSYNLFF